MRYEMRYLKEIDLSAAASAVVKYFALLDFPFSKKRHRIILGTWSIHLSTV